MPKQYNISLLEKRRDWTLIVMSQPCPEPGCGAQAGEHCQQVASSLRGLGQRSQRQDFHASRKYAAAQYLEENPLREIPEKESKELREVEAEPKRTRKRKAIPTSEQKVNE